MAAEKARDDVVPVEQASGNRFTNTVNIDWRSSDEGEHKGGDRSQQHWDHEDPEDPNVQAACAGQERRAGRAGKPVGS